MDVMRVLSGLGIPTRDDLDGDVVLDITYCIQHRFTVPLGIG